MENWGSQHLPAIFYNIHNGKYDNLIPLHSILTLLGNGHQKTA